jgi:hypothetical protein
MFLQLSFVPDAGFRDFRGFAKKPCPADVGLPSASLESITTDNGGDVKKSVDSIEDKIVER